MHPPKKKKKSTKRKTATAIPSASIGRECDFSLTGTRAPALSRAPITYAAPLTLRKDTATFPHSVTATTVSLCAPQVCLRGSLLQGRSATN